MFGYDFRKYSKFVAIFRSNEDYYTELFPNTTIQMNNCILFLTAKVILRVRDSKQL